MEIKDITGHFFGEINVIGDIGQRGSKGGVRWLCKCSCGREFFSESWFLRNRTHCGCKTKLSEDERKERKRLQARQYYKKNKERLRAEAREFYRKNKKKITANMRKRYHKNIEAERTRARNYKNRVKNTDKEIRSNAIEAFIRDSVLTPSDLPENLIKTKMNQIKLNRLILGRME